MLIRDRYLIPRRLLPPVMLLGQAPQRWETMHAGVRSELRRCGLVTPGGLLTEGAAGLVSTMTEASLVSSVDVQSGGTTHSSTIWATAGGATLGRQLDGDTCELTSVRPRSLPLVLASLVDVGRRPEPPFFGAGVLADAALTLALERAADASDAAIDVLVAAGLDRTWADRLLIAHEHMRSRWTISSVWTDTGGGHHVRHAAVLDGGAAGYWRIQPQASDPPASRYSVITLEQVMRLLRSTLPEPGSI